MTPLIQFDHVSFSYDDAASPAVSDLSLAIEPGSFVAVLGHNGSGKSTFAKLCNGLILPSSGTVTVDGIDTADENKALTVKNTVGLVFQNPDNQIVASVVEEDVAFGLENIGVAYEEMDDRIHEALSAVGMDEFRLAAPYHLSGGQKQRIAIAGILAMRPRCIVLDEPTSMLDPVGRRDVLETVHTLCKERGVTIVLITHFMDETVDADRVIVMNEGKAVLDGTPESVFDESEYLRSVGLEVPPAKELLYLLDQQGIRLSSPSLRESDCLHAVLTALGKERP